MSERTVGELNPPERLLLGPGPANIPPRVYRAMTAPLLGHLDPAFLAIMDETVELLRRVLRTRNNLTLAVSGTGSAGMESALCNVLEPGDTAVVGVCGYFGDRIAEMASRYGARVVRIEGEWGLPLPLEKYEQALKRERKVKVVTAVHGETSTGVLQPVHELAKVAHDHGALLLVDTVTTLGGADVRVDDWALDVVYSGTQKCIGAPPGLAPLTLGARAVEAVKARKTRTPNWYLDVTLLDKYWGGERVYHHTAPISMVYALREALRVVSEEGLEARHARHRRAAEALWAGLEAMGLALHVPAEHRVPSLTTVRIPPGVDDAAARKTLLTQHNIEIGGGLGPLKGKVWRIGLMGYNATPQSVFALLGALEQTLRKQGFETAAGAGLAAAQRALAA